jgi:hypothetical protein
VYGAVRIFKIWYQEQLSNVASNTFDRVSQGQDVDLAGILDVSAGMHLNCVTNSYATIVAGTSVHTNLFIVLVWVLTGEGDADSLSSLFSSKFDGVSSENVELVHLCFGKFDNCVVIIL